MSCPSGQPPSILKMNQDVVVHILSYLPWADKIVTVQAIPAWTPCLFTTSAWKTFVKRTVEGNHSTSAVTTNHFGGGRKKTEEANEDCLRNTVENYGSYFQEVEMNYLQDHEFLDMQGVLEQVASSCTRMKKFSQNVSNKLQHLVQCRQYEVVDTLNHIGENTNASIKVSFPKFIDFQDPISHTLNKDIAPVTLLNMLEKRGPLENISQLECYFPKSCVNSMQGLSNFYLEILSVSVHILNTNIICELAKKKLSTLCLLDDTPTIEVTNPSIDWLKVQQIKPSLRVHYRFQDRPLIPECITDNPLLFSLVLDTLWTPITQELAETMTRHFRSSLQIFAIIFCEMEESLISKMEVFQTLTTGFVLMKTLVISMAIEAPILLMITRWQHNLRHLMVAECDIIIKPSAKFLNNDGVNARCGKNQNNIAAYLTDLSDLQENDNDMSETEDFSDLISSLPLDLREWVADSCKDLPSLEAAISQCLGYCWSAMSEKEFSAKTSFLQKVTYSQLS